MLKPHAPKHGDDVGRASLAHALDRAAQRVGGVGIVHHDLGEGVQGSGFRVQGSGFRV